MGSSCAMQQTEQLQHSQAKLTRGAASTGSEEAAKRCEAGEAENELSGWTQGLSNIVQAVTQAPHLLSDQLQGTVKDAVNKMCLDHMKTIEATLLDLKHRMELLESTQMKEQVLQPPRQQHEQQAALPQIVLEAGVGNSECNNGCLSQFEAMQSAFSNLERRLEKIEIKDMEAGIADWPSQRARKGKHRLEKKEPKNMEGERTDGDPQQVRQSPKLVRFGQHEVHASICVDEWQDVTIGRRIPPDNIQYTSQMPRGCCCCCCCSFAAAAVAAAVAAVAAAVLVLMTSFLKFILFVD